VPGPGSAGGSHTSRPAVSTMTGTSRRDTRAVPSRTPIKSARHADPDDRSQAPGAVLAIVRRCYWGWPGFMQASLPAFRTPHRRSDRYRPDSFH
jgi:hypothetical protein